MNKILPYLVIAIFLGTVTMVVPYTLLGSSDYTSIIEGDTLIQPSPAQTEQPSAPTESSTPMPTPEPVPSAVPSAAPSPLPEPSAAVTETASPDNQERTNSEGENFLSGDSLTPSPSAPIEPGTTPFQMASPIPSPFPSPAPSLVPETSGSEPYNPEETTSTETESPLAPQPVSAETDLITKSLSHLSAIGLMIIPSFLIALGAFVYLKNWRS